MRDILFRGKTEKGEWVYGDLLHPDNYGNGYSIEDFTKDKNNCFDVIPETVGQYTGLTDKNGKMIFEGDIVSFKRINALGYTTSRIGDVKYYDELPIFYIMATTGDAWDWAECEDIEVIGNIHDNPELIGGADNA